MSSNRYPSDPKCSKWLESNRLNPLFSFPDYVRFSWEPAKKVMKELDIKVEWQAEEDEEDEIGDVKQTRMNIF